MTKDEKTARGCASKIVEIVGTRHRDGGFHIRSTFLSYIYMIGAQSLHPKSVELCMKH